MSTQSGETYRLNRSEKTYLAVEGLWGSFTQVYAVRFSAPIEPEAVRTALREVVRAHPRLRSVVDRTLLGHRLRVLPEGPTVDNLFELSFRVWPAGGTDDASLGPLMTMVMDEPFAIERDLPIKARFIPHHEKPVVLVSMHHIAGDGKSVMGWLRSLHRVLNGKTLEVRKVDPPGYDAALVPRSMKDFGPAFVGAVRQLLAPRAVSGRPILPPQRKLYGFAPGATYPFEHTVAAPALVRAARARGTTLGSLVFAASAIALHNLVPNATGPVRARLSIDLRDLFPEGRAPGDGNYVSSFFVEVEPKAGLDAMLPVIDSEMKQGIDRYHRREMFLAGFFNELAGLLGRKLFGMTVLAAKNRDMMPEQSFHFSNVGRADGFDAGEVQIDAIFPSLVHHDIFIATVGFRGRLLTSISYPRGEIESGVIEQLAKEIDRVLLESIASAAPADTSGTRTAAS